MGAIQVKNVPDDLHEELRRRAAERGSTVGEVVLEALRRDLRRMSVEDWVERVRAIAPRPERPTRAQVHAAWRAARRDHRFDGDDRG